MGTQQYQTMLDVAKEQVSRGIYAVEKKGYAELKNENVKSTTELVRKIRAYRMLGFKVYYNK